MAEPALETLLDIVRDPASGLRNRLSAAVAASRVSKLAMPGEQPPEAVMYLREIVGTEHEGSRFRVEFRREAATALSYYERRCKKAELQYIVPDRAERAASWRRLVNGALVHTMKGPRDKRLLLTAAADIEVYGRPDPDLVLSAMLSGAHNRHERRKARAIDEKVTAVWSGTEEQRRELLKPLAQLVHQRLAERSAA